MIRTFMIGLITAVAATIMSSAGAQAAELEIKRQNVQPYTKAFLKKAAQEQQAQVMLGQLAAAQAKNTRVKEFGEEIAAAHKKLLREVRELAARRDTQLPTELADDDMRAKKELAQTSGHAFDRAYLQYILREHQNYVNEFEESMLTMEDAQVSYWAHKTLPMLRAHVEDARWDLHSLQTSP